MTTPIIKIFLDGQDISGKVNSRILSGTVDRFDGEKADTLSLILSNFDGVLAKPKRGAALQVALGSAAFGVYDRGNYIVQGVTKTGGPATFHVSAHSADLKKTLKAQKTRSFKAPKTLGDVMAQIAGDNGLQLAMSAALKATAIDKIIVQSGESDMHFSQRLARRYGALCKFAEGKMTFVARGAGESSSGAALPAQVLTPNDFEEFSIADNDRQKRGKSKAHVWDHHTAKKTELTGSAGGDGPDYTFPEVFGSKTEAQKAVDGRAKEFARAEKTFSGTLREAVTPPNPGSVMTTQGFGDDDDTTWVIKQVSDDFHQRGLVTKIRAELKVASSTSGGTGQGAGTSQSSSTATVQEAGTGSLGSNVG